MIAIIDYGMGNLRSIQKAFERVGAKARISSSLNVIRNAKKVVLPGVGAFGAAMKELDKRGLLKIIKALIKKGRPFLGLCLGMQVLFSESEEARGIEGLSILEGKVKRFKSSLGLKIPHMGWNRIKIKTTHASRGCPESKIKILNRIPNRSFMYFVHSYYVEPKDSDIVVAWTDYGINFPAIIHKNNLYAMQFHPEKSQRLGLRIIENFVRI